MFPDRNLLQPVKTQRHHLKMQGFLDRQADREGGWGRGRQTERQRGREAERQTDRQGGRQADRKTGRQAGREGGGEADRQGGGQTGRQTGREASFLMGCLL